MLHFRPLWTFTAVMLVLCLSCIGLGLWQIHRLHWKLDLIAQVNRNLRLPAIPLQQALAAGMDEIQYRHVRLRGRFLISKEAYIFAPGENGTANYHVITPLVLGNGSAILVDRGIVPEKLRDPRTRAAGEPQGERDVTGVLRVPEPAGVFTPSPNLPQHIWYSRDLEGIARSDGIRIVAPVLVEADSTPNPGGWPEGGQTVVAFRNDHLQYAITWFALAAVTFGGWVAYHLSHGRLMWGGTAHPPD